MLKFYERDDLSREDFLWGFAEGEAADSEYANIRNRFILEVLEKAIRNGECPLDQALALAKNPHFPSREVALLHLSTSPIAVKTQ